MPRIQLCRLESPRYVGSACQAASRMSCRISSITSGLGTSRRRKNGYNQSAHCSTNSAVALRSLARTLATSRRSSDTNSGAWAGWMGFLAATGYSAYMGRVGEAPSYPPPWRPLKLGTWHLVTFSGRTFAELTLEGALPE